MRKEHKATLTIYVEANDPPPLDELITGILDGLPSEWFDYQYEDDFILSNVENWEGEYVEK